MPSINQYSQPGARRLAGNTIWNLLGMCLPMVAALFAIPLLITGLGNARFGLLGLVWMLVGYFSIFDMGLGRALTKMASARLGANKAGDMPRLFWTAMLLMLALGIIIALIVAAAAPLLAGHLLKVPDHLQIEARRAFYVVAAGMPIVITTTGLIGMLEAYQFFRQINFVRIPTGSFTFLGPLCVLPFTNSLTAVVAVLICGRLAETISYMLLCLYKIPALRCRPHISRELIRPMAGFGGWLTVSNLTMPLMAHVDRFFVGALVSVTAVAFYVTPAEIVIKLLIIPRALVSVLFPTFSAGAAGSPQASARLFGRGLKYLPGLVFPAVLVLVTFAPDGLRLWLTPEYALHSAPVMRWLAAGVFLNGLAYVPFSFLQGMGRPDLPARLHLVELILYVIIAPFFIRAFGINGAAMAWCLRATVDLLALLWFAGHLAPDSRPDILKTITILALGLVILAITVLPETLWMRLIVAIAGGLLGCAFYWFSVFNSSERGEIMQRMGMRKNGI